MSMNETMALDQREFKILLEGNKGLREQLEEFKKFCDVHEKHRHRKCKRRYYQLGLVARIVCSTTDDELDSLISNGVQTFMFDAVSNRPPALFELVKHTLNAIEKFQNEEPKKRVITGLAFEIHGDACRLGRMRNDCSVMACRGDVVTLTVDETYKYSGFKEVIYVLNLKYYLQRLKICDILKIGNNVLGRVVKVLKTNIAVLIEAGGLITSYEFIEIPEQCIQRTEQDMVAMFREDLETINELGAHYAVVPKIRCKTFVRTLRQHMEREYSKMKLIGHIDLEYVRRRMCDLLGIIKSLDYLWIPDFYKLDKTMQAYVFEDVIPLAKCLKKPIIGSVPLQRCSDFKHFENSDFLWKIDSIFIEKSEWCFKYPLIVKKLLPIRDFHYGVLDNAVPIKHLLTSYQSIVNFIIRTISTIECRAIFLYTRCQAAAIALSRVEVYCPVYVMIPLNDPNATESETECKINLARSLNLRRNSRAILYTTAMNECNYTPIDYGINYARKRGCVDTGDFIITVEVVKEDEQNAQIGGTEDVVILRAYYLPPQKFTEKFMYS